MLFEMAREVNRLRELDPVAAAGLAARLKELAEVLGVLQLEPEAFLQAGAEGKVDAAVVDGLIAARLQARRFSPCPFSPTSTPPSSYSS